MEHKLNETKKSEKGQIIVLLAISLVVVIVVGALAVDGGMIYSERRFAQNSADASSLAGGGVVLHYMEEYDPDTKTYQVVNETFVCPGTSSYVEPESIPAYFSQPENIIAKAYNEALQAYNINKVDNLPFLGYIGHVSVEDGSGNVTESIITEDFGLSENHGVIIECNSFAKDKYVNVTTRVTSRVSTAFAHLIFPGPLTTTNEATTNTQPRRNIGYGNGIVSLSDTCQNNTDGMEFTGTGDITVFGGGIHSNSCLTGSGNVTVYSNPVFDEFGNLLYTDGSINLNDESAVLNGGAILDPTPTGGIDPLEIDAPEGPTCSDTGVLTGTTYSPGKYPSGIRITNGTWFFEDGIYCVNGDLEITGGTVEGYGVMFYMIDGDVRITGNASVQLTAPVVDPWAGMLIYLAPGNEGLVYLVGTNDSYFSGTVFAPDGNIEAGGTSEGVTLDEEGCELSDDCFAATFNVQFIGWYVKVVGTSEIDITYDETSNFYVVGKLDLQH
jgi:hypothetical protein